MKIAVVGAGNWGTTVARLVAKNIAGNAEFDSQVKLWIYDEPYNNTTLSKYINTHHENPKYLKSIKLPLNITAITSFDLQDIDILIFCIPVQFLTLITNFKLKKRSIGISLIKGLLYNDGILYTPSEFINRITKINCGCLTGPNIANEVAVDLLSETVLGIKDGMNESLLLQLLSSDLFIVKIKKYKRSLELVGAVKNVVSLACGMAYGVTNGHNTKAMAFRKGLDEMIKLCRAMDEEIEMNGAELIGDLYVSCETGRNYRCGVEMGKEKISYKEYEERMGGQKLQGPETAHIISKWIDENKIKEDEYRILIGVNDICKKGKAVESIIEAIKTT